MASRAAVLWTGGKDCTLALCRARDVGLRIPVLATFYPAGESHPFKAHPLERLHELATAANFPHELIPVQQPYDETYVNGLKGLSAKWRIDAVVTGDVDRVEDLPNWIRQCTQRAGLEAVMPLWQSPRESLLRELIHRGIRARVSWVNSPYIPETWLDRVIDTHFIDDIIDLAKNVPIDICGENGEYHTMVEGIPPGPTLS